jgi:hypothetical protein
MLHDGQTEKMENEMKQVLLIYFAHIRLPLRLCVVYHNVVSRHIHKCKLLSLLLIYHFAWLAATYLVPDSVLYNSHSGYPSYYLISSEIFCTFMRWKIQVVIFRFLMQYGDVW